MTRETEKMASDNLRLVVICSTVDTSVVGTVVVAWTALNNY